MLLERIILICLLTLSAQAYESEETLQSAIVGKIAEYITWPGGPGKRFTIAILKNRMDDQFDRTYKNIIINGTPVHIVEIDRIDAVKSPEVVYISNRNTKQLADILDALEGLPVLTISDIRGFAEKGGMVQIYFSDQRMRLKVNLDALAEHDLVASPALLRVVDVVKDDN